MTIDKEQIFEIIKANTLRILPDVRSEQVTIDGNLSDLGANSIDRVEIVMYSLEQLRLKIPPSELHGLKNLRALVELLHRHSIPE